MNLHEFIEALARLAERISPVAIGEIYEKWDIIQRQVLPLHVKLETILTSIHQKVFFAL
jgi:hypothetical protein